MVLNDSFWVLMVTTSCYSPENLRPEGSVAGRRSDSLLLSTDQGQRQLLVAPKANLFAVVGPPKTGSIDSLLILY